jgi:CHAT domain-containing protein
MAVDNKMNIAQSHYEKGRVLNALGNYQGALTLFEEAIVLMSEAIAEKSDTVPELARRMGYFLTQTAAMARKNGNIELAKLRLEQVPSLYRHYRWPQTVFEAPFIEANVYNDEGDFTKAIEIYQRLGNSQELKKEYERQQAAVVTNLSVAHLKAGNLTLAEEKMLEGLALLRGNDLHLNVAAAYGNLLKLRTKQQRYDETPEILKQGLSEANMVYPNGKGPIIGELYARAGEAQALAGNYGASDSLFQRSVQALIEESAIKGAAKLPVIQGAAIYSQEDLLELLTYKRNAFRQAYRAGANPGGLQLALATSHTIDTLLRLNRDQLNLTASLGQFIRQEAEEYTAAVDIALEIYRSTGDDAFLNQAYQFAAGQKSNLLRRYLTSPGLAASLGVPLAVVDQKSDLELRVLTTERALQNAAGPDQAVLRDSLLRLNAAVDKLKRQIASDHPAFARALRGFPAIDPAAAAATLDDDQLVVEYFLSADSVYLFTLSRAEGLAVRVVERPDDLTVLVGSVVDQGAGATRLYDLLIAPLLAGREEITRLQLIPDGALWKLPFAALKNGDRFLIEDYAVSYAYAAPLLFDPELATRAAARTEDYLGYGISYEDLQADLTGGGLRAGDAEELRNMGQLPFAIREVTRAAEIIGGTPRLNPAATLKRFIAESAGANILHLSMHGLLRANPMTSALVFRGENDEGYALLTMADVLAGNYPAELTVLSACHTGGGPLQTSEGMQSIGRAFTAAGSRATITSTWAARDETTHDILSRFFGELNDGGAKDVAFQVAVKDYLANGTAADRQPEKWANLTLTGSVSPIKKKRTAWVAIVLGFGVALFLGGRALSQLKKKAGTRDAG